MTSYNDNQALVIKEALRQTELRLSDLQGNAASSEARAFSFATAGILLATLVSAVADRFPHPSSLFVAALGFVVSSVWVLWSVLPRKFHVRGHYWAYWAGHVADDDHIHIVIMSQAEENDARIIFNVEALEFSAKRFKQGLYFAFLTVCFAIGGQLGAL